MSLFDTLADLEDNDELHIGRLLLLLKAFAGRKGSGTVDGLTKLAKLDFLLRYPVYLERALARRKAGLDVPAVDVQDHERKSIESSMIRFKYGPWDPRYRRFLNLMIAKGLVNVVVEGKTHRIGLTQRGLDIGESLSEAEASQAIVKRARILERHFDLTATSLMKFVYETFPEIGTLRMGEEIGHED